MRRAALSFGLAIAVLVCSQYLLSQLRGYYPRAGADMSPEDVSLIQVIANPQQYDGKQIRFIGFLSLEFEGNAVYLHQEDYENGITRNAISIYVPSDMSAVQKTDTNLHYVICAGTFRASNHGHMELTSGALSDVYRLEVWPASQRHRSQTGNDD